MTMHAGIHISKVNMPVYNKVNKDELIKEYAELLEDICVVTGGPVVPFNVTLAILPLSQSHPGPNPTLLFVRSKTI